MNAIKNNFFASLAGYLSVVVFPRSYFENTERPILRRNALYGAGVLLVLLSLLVFLSALLNMEGLRQVQQEFLRAMKIDPDLLPASSLPFSSLAFGLYWALLLALLGPVRHLMLRVLGEAERSLALAYWISIHGAVPMMLAGALITMFNNLLPPALSGPASAGGGARLVLTSLFAILSFGYELLLSTTGFRRHYHQNVGRAALTALAPWILIAFLLLLFPRPS